MIKDIYNNPKKSQSSRNITNLLLRVFGFNNPDSFVGLIIWGVAIIFKVLSIGAKILTRKKVGIRSVGVVGFILHVVPISALVIHSLYSEDTMIISNSEEGLYLLLYMGLVSIFWITNFIMFKKRTGYEGNSYFRGYGLLAPSKVDNEKNLRWVRLTDPLILGIITWTLVQFLDASFRPTSILLYASGVILFIEELLHIYAEYNFELDWRDANRLSEQKGKESTSSNSGY